MPHVPAQGVRTLFVAVSGLTALVMIGLALTDMPSNLWALVVALPGLFVAVRSTKLGIRADGDDVVIDNIFRSERIPIRDLDRFDVAHTRTHGGPTLVVVSGARQVAVTAFPITRIPRVGERRLAVVDSLNRWLRDRPA